MIKMVVFDMAGTTVDEDNIVYKTLLKTINHAGYNFSLQQVLEHGAGKEKLTAIKDIIALDKQQQDETIANKIYTAFVSELEIAYNNYAIKPQPNAQEVFASLIDKNVYVVLNTGYDKKTALTILEKLGWHEGEQIDALITASDVAQNRPKPDMIFLAMQKMGIPDANDVAKIGDSIIDIEEGKNAGCFLNIGITTGAHTSEQLATANPDYIINNLLQLLPIIIKK